MRASWLIALVLASGCRRPPPTTPIPSSPPPSAEVAPPARAPAPAPPRKPRSYESRMILVDGALFVASFPLLRQADGLDDGLLVLWGAIYLASGPLIHAANGNNAQVPWSLGRRLAYPTIGAAAAYLLGDDCEGDAACVVLYLVGAGVGLVAAAVHDWTKAVEPTVPVVIVDADKVVVGIGRRF